MPKLPTLDPRKQPPIASSIIDHSYLQYPISPLFAVFSAFFIYFPTTCLNILTAFSPAFSALSQHLVKLLNICARFCSRTPFFHPKTRARCPKNHNNFYSEQLQTAENTL